LPPRPGGGGGGGGSSLSDARRQWQQQQQSGSYAVPSGAPLSSGGPGSGSFGSFSNPLLAPVRSGGSAGSGPGSRGGSGASLAGGGAGGSGVGVAGIMAREQTKAAVTGQALDAAFSDLRALMAAAAEMVELAERFRQQQAAASAGGDGSVSGSAGGGEAALDAETALALAAMGIVSPVTRASAGAQYHQQLARQLSDFLEAPLGRAGGLLMLPDVYCLFNRARGTELVSPDDLVTACELFEALGLPLRLRRFASGVVVVQSAAHTDAALCARIGELVRGGGGDAAAGAAAGLGPALSASAVGVALGLPVTLAREALLVAEASGVVCRDDGPEGLRFFRNFFGEPEAAAAAAALVAAC
jgi:ESCRT-II complex subunit VPS36